MKSGESKKFVFVAVAAFAVLLSVAAGVFFNIFSGGGNVPNEPGDTTAVLSTTIIDASGIPSLDAKGEKITLSESEKTKIVTLINKIDSFDDGPPTKEINFKTNIDDIMDNIGLIESREIAIANGEFNYDEEYGNTDYYVYEDVFNEKVFGFFGRNMKREPSYHYSLQSDDDTLYIGFYSSREYNKNYKYKIAESYDLGNSFFKIVCHIAYGKDSPISRIYTAIVKKDENATHGFYFISRKYEHIFNMQNEKPGSPYYEMFMEIINKASKNYVPNIIRYTIYDIDGDCTPELILDYTSSEGLYKVYTAINDKAKFVVDIPVSFSANIYEKTTGGLYEQGGHQGHYWCKQITLNNGKFTEKMIWEGGEDDYYSPSDLEHLDWSYITDHRLLP